MYKKAIGILLLLAFLVTPAPVKAQWSNELQNFWNQLRVGALKYTNVGVLASGYVTFGNTVGTNGYGIRDSAGTMQFKNSGGAWQNITAGALPSGGCVSWNSDTFLQRVSAANVGVSSTCGGANTGTFTAGNIASVTVNTTGSITASGGTSDVTAGRDLNLGAGRYVAWAGSSLIGSPANGVFQFWNGAANSGLRLDVVTTNNVAAFVSSAGADTAIVKASQFNVGANVGTIAIESSGLKFVSGGVGVAIGTAVGGTTYNFNSSAVNFNSGNSVDWGASATPGRSGYFGTLVSSVDYTFNGTTGKTGTACTAFTVGGCTAATEPTDYVANYLKPWVELAGYHLLTIDEYADFVQMRAAFRSTDIR